MANSIHPTAVLTGEIQLGEGNVIGPHVVITGPVTIGDGNWFGTGTIIGAPPEVRSVVHSDEMADGGGVHIGRGNVIREYAQNHQGWKSRTVLADDLFIMNQAYVAHDCTLGSGVTLASSVLLAGHVVVGAGANLGLGTAVHQGRFIGAGAMVGMGTVVTRDLPPFSKAFGNPAKVRGANVIGMERAQVPAAAIAAVVAAYSSPHPDPAAIERLNEHPALFAEIREWLEATAH